LRLPSRSLVIYIRFLNQIRRQLPFVTINITNPGTRPLAPITPPGVPPPTSDEKISAYFVKYLMSPDKEPNEAYTYAEFIHYQLFRIINLLAESGGNTNQATICIGDKATTFLSDPPCLRSISFKVYEGKLQMCVYFRSWDLFAGLPENLGGFQMLKEFVLSHITPFFKVEDGPMVAFSNTKPHL